MILERIPVRSGAIFRYDQRYALRFDMLTGLTFLWTILIYKISIPHIQKNGRCPSTYTSNRIEIVIFCH